MRKQWYTKKLPVKVYHIFGVKGSFSLPLLFKFSSIFKTSNLHLVRGLTLKGRYIWINVATISLFQHEWAAFREIIIRRGSPIKNRWWTNFIHLTLRIPYIKAFVILFELLSLRSTSKPVPPMLSPKKAAISYPFTITELKYYWSLFFKSPIPPHLVSKYEEVLICKDFRVELFHVRSKLLGKYYK